MGNKSAAASEQIPINQSETMWDTMTKSCKADPRKTNSFKTNSCNLTTLFTLCVAVLAILFAMAEGRAQTRDPILPGVNSWRDCPGVRPGRRKRRGRRLRRRSGGHGPR